jgi:hypothetical protein
MTHSSRRNYARSLEPPAEGPRVARHEQDPRQPSLRGADRDTLRELRSRDLGVLSVCAIAIDGIHVGEHLVAVALGIDEAGGKHALGLHDATENEAMCKVLLPTS